MLPYMRFFHTDYFTLNFVISNQTCTKSLAILLVYSITISECLFKIKINFSYKMCLILTLRQQKQTKLKSRK